MLVCEIGVRLLRLVPPVHAIWVSDDDSFYERSTNPVLNYRIKPSFQRMTHSGQATSNEHGFRDQPRTQHKPADVRRILLLGDSVVEGINYVDDENTISRHLERLYPDSRTEVLNLGTSGYCTLAEVTLLQEHGLAFQPDLVVLLFVENDYNNFNPEHTVAGGVRDRPAWAKRLFVASHLYRYLSLRFNWFGFADESDPTTWNRKAIGRNNVVDGLRRLRELANENKFDVMIVPWPVFEDRSIDHPNTEGSKPLIIERLAAMNGLPARRIDTAFDSGWRSISPLPNPRKHFTVRGDGMHPNNLGSAMAAKLIHAIIDQPFTGHPYEPGPPDPEAEKLAALRAGNIPFNPTSIEGRVFQSLMYRDRVDEAHDYLVSVLKKDPANPWANYCLGWSIFQGPAPTNALPFLGNAVSLLPKETGARTRFAYVLSAMGRHDEATRTLQQGIQASPEDADLHFALGAIAITNADYQSARSHLKTAKKLDPADQRAIDLLRQLGATTNGPAFNR